MLYRQTDGITMGTKCASLEADLQRIKQIFRISHFFASLEISFNNSVHITCQIFAEIYKKIYHQQIKLFIFTRCVRAFNNSIRVTMSPSLLPFR